MPGREKRKKDLIDDHCDTCEGDNKVVTEPQARRNCDVISFLSDMGTDGPTDQPTNIVSYRGATSRLKRGKVRNAMFPKKKGFGGLLDQGHDFVYCKIVMETASLLLFHSH
jgi:hypothetical protein